MSETPEIIWKDAVGFEGYYQVSSNGRVRSIPRIDHGGSHLRGVERALHVSGPGYPMVSLRMNMKQFRVYVHSLVASAFIGPRPPRHEVNHKNGIKTDNKVENLEYVTVRENYYHARSLGLIPLGEQKKNTKLKEFQVKEIRTLLSMGLSQDTIAPIFGISQGAISKINLRQCWSHVP